MKTTYDLSQLDWKLSGWTPEYWRSYAPNEISTSVSAEIPDIPAKVPGSVQHSLLHAGLIPDWNVGLNYFQCEWVENRHWIYQTILPDNWIERGKTYRLRCLGLDYSGEVYLNGRMVAEFRDTFIPHTFNLTPYLQEKDNLLRIVFTSPPRWLGQFGRTSRIKEWKARFNYTWDWTPRLVQIGIWDSIFLEATDGRELTEFRCFTDADPSSSTGSLRAWGEVRADADASIVLSLSREDSTIREEKLPVTQFNSDGASWSELPVALWWPNLHGDQPLYTLSAILLDKAGCEIDRLSRRVGFKNVAWEQCKGAPPNADPWICVVNGKRIFLAGVNWTPIRTNFADVTEADYRRRLEIYKDIGLNIFRVWGGAVLEKECFYDLCDEMGFMVWQEFPLSSTEADNWPPTDEKAIEDQARFAESYIARRQHHVSLALWCGGNELIDYEFKPCTTGHPLLHRLKGIVEREDPTRRFLATSPSGPEVHGHQGNFGKGVNWDVHGPWKPEGALEDWEQYWKGDDALFRSETGSSGASSAELIRKYAGDLSPMPADNSNQLWRRGSNWWIEWGQFIAEQGREPKDLEEYVAWSQERQSRALSIAVKACKDRFPRCGGVIIWMGHDCYPCTANTALIDFDGNPKPAATAVGEIFKS